MRQIVLHTASRERFLSVDSFLGCHMCLSVAIFVFCSIVKLLICFFSFRPLWLKSECKRHKEVEDMSYPSLFRYRILIT
jgi:hypothetical protein